MKSPDLNSLFNPQLTGASNNHKVSSGRELADLIHSISPADFINSYFSKKSFTLPGESNKFDEIFSWERLQRALAVGRTFPDRRYNLKASFTSGEELGSPRPVIEAQHDQIDELYRAGATICITNIHMTDPELASWAQAIRAQLNFSGTVGVNCYISPDGSGLPVHYDKRIATSLQITGKKHWRFSTEAAKPWPSHNARYVHGHVEPVGVNPGKLPPEMEFQEVELTPGDLLCIPAGAWHSARAVGDCMALNLYFAPRNFMDQLMPLIQSFAFANEEWRAGAPPSTERVQGNMPENVTTYIAERLSEFNDWMQTSQDRPDAVAEAWLNSLTVHPYTGWRPTPKPSPKPKKPEQQFRVIPSSLHFLQTSDQLALASEYGILNLSIALAPILRKLSSQSEMFTLEDVMKWRETSDTPTLKEIVNCFQCLIDNGIIAMVD